jgi:hypothetical protein
MIHPTSLLTDSIEFETLPAPAVRGASLTERGELELPVPIWTVRRQQEFDSNAPDYDGDLPKLYKRVQKHLNLSPENPNISNSLKRMLTGFISIFNRRPRSCRNGVRHAAAALNPGRSHESEPIAVP